MDVRTGRSGVFNITGGSISGVTGVNTNLGGSAMPLIGLSTGSVSAVGAVSGITALGASQVFASTYCYYPANILATSIAAGWYYTTFQSTTTATAFLNQWTSGAPTIPSSPTPVTDGKGAFTGDTGEEFLPSIAVPALNINSALFLQSAMACNNSGGSKTMRARLSGQAGTIIYTRVGTTGGFVNQVVMQNAGSTSLQTVFGIDNLTAGSSAIYGAAGAGAVPTQIAIATSAATSLVFSIQRNTATDNMILNYYSAALAL